MSNGLNDYAGNPEMRVGLREPFPAHLISKLPATSGRPALDYVGHAAVTDRLNAICPGWTMSEPQVVTVHGIWVHPDPKKKETFEPYNDGQEHVLAVVASMTIGSVTRWEVGDVDRPSHYGDELKKALSDWIRRASMRFGVALDLWAKEDLLKTSPAATTLPAAERDGGDGPHSRSADTTNVPAAQSVAASPVAATEGSESYGEGGSEPTILPGTDGLATEQQWTNLLAAVQGNKNRAVTKVNKANRTAYSYAAAREGATWAELAAAMGD